MIAASRAPRPRLAWVEEWMSTLAREVLPGLAERYAVTYVTTGEEVPPARFVEVIRARRRRTMNLAGFDLSRQVTRLYDEGRIDLALVWASIGFALRRVPFINFEGTSVYAEIELFAARAPWHRRARFLPGLVHYALPEISCNRRAARVVTPSRALKDDIVRLHRLPEDRVVVVPHGVEPRHLEVYAGKVLPDRPRVLFLGRLHFRKGIVPAALEFTRRRDLDVEFHVAGDGPDRAALERLAADDPRLRILGPLDRAALDELLRTTSIFVMPTFYEGFGLALLEAMASGHACVAYDIAVVREVLGDTGILTPLADTAALWDAVARLLRDRSEAAALARRAHARARQFSWPEAGEAIDRVIKATAAPLGAVARPAVTAPV